MIETISQPKNPMITKKSATTISPITLLTLCPIVSDFPAANSAADAAFLFAVKYKKKSIKMASTYCIQFSRREFSGRCRFPVCGIIQKKSRRMCPITITLLSLPYQIQFSRFQSSGARSKKNRMGNYIMGKSAAAMSLITYKGQPTNNN